MEQVLALPDSLLFWSVLGVLQKRLWSVFILARLFPWLAGGGC